MFCLARCTSRASHLKQDEFWIDRVWILCIYTKKKQNFFPYSVNLYLSLQELYHISSIIILSLYINCTDNSVAASAKLHPEISHKRSSSIARSIWKRKRIFRNNILELELQYLILFIIYLYNYVPDSWRKGRWALFLAYRYLDFCDVACNKRRVQMGRQMMC